MSSTENTIQENSGGNVGLEENEMSRSKRFYYLHAEETKQKKREKYNNDPEVIRKRQEREAKKAAKEAEKQAKLLEKEVQRKINLEKALKTSQKKPESPAF